MVLGNLCFRPGNPKAFNSLGPYPQANRRKPLHSKETKMQMTTSTVLATTS